MAVYTHLDLAQARSLLAHFGLQATAIEPLSHGLANSNYRVSGPDAPVVLTVCDEKDGAEVRRLAALHQHLVAHGFPTCAYLPGSGQVQHDGRPVTVRSYIAGDVSDQLPAGALSELGGILARLHGIPAPQGLPTQHPYGLDGFGELTGHDHPFAAWLAERQADLGARLQAIPGPLPRGLCHADLFADNIVVQGDRIQAVLDFEEAACLPLALDLGMTIVGTCTVDGAVDLGRLSLLVRGYQAQRPLEPAERAALQAFVELGAVATAFWRFRQFHLLRPSPEQAQAHLPMQRLADAVRAVPAERFRLAL